jgi:hypothetical protein
VREIKFYELPVMLILTFLNIDRNSPFCHLRLSENARNIKGNFQTQSCKLVISRLRFIAHSDVLCTTKSKLIDGTVLEVPRDLYKS